MPEDQEQKRGEVEVIGKQSEALRFHLDINKAPVARGDGQFDLLQRQVGALSSGSIAASCNLEPNSYSLGAAFQYKPDGEPEEYVRLCAAAVEALVSLREDGEQTGSAIYNNLQQNNGSVVLMRHVDDTTALRIKAHDRGINFDLLYGLGTQHAGETSSYDGRSPRSDAITLLRTVNEVVNNFCQNAGEADRTEMFFSVPPEELAIIPRAGKELVQVPRIEFSDKDKEGGDVAEVSASAFDKFGGLDREIYQIRTVLAAWQHPELAEEYGIDLPTAILLHGPGGVGKTELARATAVELGAKLFETKVPDIISTFANGSAENLQTLFNKVKAQPGFKVVFLNEFDGLFGKRASGNEGVAATLVATFKGILNDLRTQYPGTLVIADSNDISTIDQALLRKGRFDTVIPISLPGAEGRSAIFAKHIARHQTLYDLPTGDMFDPDQFLPGAEMPATDSVEAFELAMATEGFSGADIEGVLKDARLSKMMARIATGQKPGPITQKDILHAIEKHRESRTAKGD